MIRSKYHAYYSIPHLQISINLLSFLFLQRTLFFNECRLLFEDSIFSCHNRVQILLLCLPLCFLVTFVSLPAFDEALIVCWEADFWWSAAVLASAFLPLPAVLKLDELYNDFDRRDLTVLGKTLVFRRLSNLRRVSSMVDGNFSVESELCVQFSVVTVNSISLTSDDPWNLCFHLN